MNGTTDITETLNPPIMYLSVGDSFQLCGPQLSDRQPEVDDAPDSGGMMHA